MKLDDYLIIGIAVFVAIFIGISDVTEKDTEILQPTIIGYCNLVTEISSATNINENYHKCIGDIYDTSNTKDTE